MSAYIPPGRVRRISALAVDAEILRNKIMGLASDLDRLDAIIERLSQDRRRGLTRGALEVLRLSNGPMALRAITLQVMAKRGLDTEDRALVNRLMEQLRVALTRQWQHGIVSREKGPGWTMLWSIAHWNAQID
jgi:hypothetical protein